MKINQKTCSILVISFSIISLCLATLAFLHYVSIDIMMIFLGFTQLFGGLNQINMAQQTNSKRFNKGTKNAGIFSIIVGIVLIVSVIIKMTL